MLFVWDPKKNELNIKNHKMPLSAGIAVWNDVNRKDYLDIRQDYGEDRILTIGMGVNGLLFVCWTERKEDEIRLISVRKATTSEKRIYNEND